MNRALAAHEACVTECATMIENGASRATVTTHIKREWWHAIAADEIDDMLDEAHDRALEDRNVPPSEFYGDWAA